MVFCICVSVGRDVAAAPRWGCSVLGAWQQVGGHPGTLLGAQQNSWTTMSPNSLSGSGLQRMGPTVMPPTLEVSLVQAHSTGTALSSVSEHPLEHFMDRC